MEKELKPIVNAVLGTIAFMVLALSAIKISYSGKIFEDNLVSANELAQEYVPRTSTAGGVPSENTLAATARRSHNKGQVKLARTLPNRRLDGC